MTWSGGQQYGASYSKSFTEYPGCIVLASGVGESLGRSVRLKSSNRIYSSENPVHANCTHTNTLHGLVFVPSRNGAPAAGGRPGSKPGVGGHAVNRVHTGSGMIQCGMRFDDENAFSISIDASVSMPSSGTQHHSASFSKKSNMYRPGLVWPANWPKKNVSRCKCS